jgi:preprotein translocase SecE subunit
MAKDSSNKESISKEIESAPKKQGKIRKPSETMRDSAAKSRAKAEKPKKVRRAASAAKKPVTSIGSALTKEYHLVEPKKGGNFFTKSRKVTPGFFRSAWAELRQVTWPGRRETWRLVFAVFIFALILGTVIAVLDYGLEKLLREVIL